MINLHPLFARTNNRLRLLTLFICICFPFSAVADDVTDSVLTIYTTSKDGSGQGTGFAFGQGGRIVTAYHVIQDSTALTVFARNNIQLQNVVVDALDPEHDIAILKTTDSAHLTPLPFSSAADVNYAPIEIAGSPRSLANQILHGNITSKGDVSSLTIRSPDGDRVFAEQIDVLPIDVTTYKGLSGAPVIASNGSVVGLLSGSWQDGRGIGWAIPIKYVVALLNSPSLNKLIQDVAVWPQLPLMNPGWESLKRAYHEKYSPDHMQRLGFLEDSFVILHGLWHSNDDSTGICTGTENEKIELRVGSLDRDEASIAGSEIDRYVWSDGHCEDEDGAKFSRQRGGVNEKGDVKFTVDHVNRDPGTNRTLSASINITDCHRILPDESEGGNCPEDKFGQRADKLGDTLEIISKDKLRWQSQIFEKQLEAQSAAPQACLLYTSPSPRDLSTSRMPSSA